MSLNFIRKLGRIETKKGYKITCGLYSCSFCLKEIIKQLGAENRQISCGCYRQTEGFKQKISIANKGKKRTDEQNKRNSETHKGKKLSKESIDKRTQKQKGLKRTDEQRKKYSEAFKGKAKSEEHKQKIGEANTGNKNGNWNNGSSFEPYTHEFNKEKKQFILERDNYTCQCPDCEYKTKLLDIHHIDYNKVNSSIENLITLCRSCHMKTNVKNKRIYWSEFYQNILVNRIVECLL